MSDEGIGMDEQGFRKFIKEGKRVPKGLNERTIKSHIRMVEEFETFLKRNNPGRRFSDASTRDIKAFIKHLAKEDRNKFENLIGLLRYARYSGNEDAALTLLVILDSGEILPTLGRSFKKKYGKRMHDKALGAYEPPPIGTPAKLMPRATNEFMVRVELGIGEDATRDFLMSNCPHVSPTEHYAEERKMLRASKNIDEYLRKRRKKSFEELHGHMKNKTPFFTQEINQEVLDFVRSEPEIEGGVRKGNMIYFTKIPYMTTDYLREEDPKMKRYHYCHCPLARESILTGETVSRNLCYCSAGYVKRPFEVAFGKNLRAEIKKSVLWGDSECRFAIEIPKEYLLRKG